MPVYVFKCESCDREFEEICSIKEDIKFKQCPGCGLDAPKKIANVFGISTSLDPRRDTIVSRKEIDKVVGEASSKRWEGYNAKWNEYYKNRQNKRREGQNIKEVVIKPESSGSVAPFEHLGSKQEQEFRKEYGKEYKKQITDQGKNNDTPVVMKKIL